MGYIGGDSTELTCSHPTLGDSRYQVKAGEAATIDKGGIRNDDSADGITGGGLLIVKKTMGRASIEVPIAVDFLSDAEMSTLNDLAASAEPGTWLYSHISGAVYKILGFPVGDINSDTSAATMKLKIAGTNLQQIA